MLKQAPETQSEQLLHSAYLLKIATMHALQLAYKQALFAALRAGMNTPFGAIKMVCGRQAAEKAKAEKDK